MRAAVGEVSRENESMQNLRPSVLFGGWNP